jgi:hypothetical protein
MGNDREFVEALRRHLAGESGLGPRMILAGFIDGPAPVPVTGYQAGTATEGVRLVREYHALGFDQIKVWNNVAPGVLQAIAAEAHAPGMPRRPSRGSYVPPVSPRFGRR